MIKAGYFIGPPRNTEVGQQYSAPAGFRRSQQDIRRFDITVQQLTITGEIKRVGDGVQNIEHVTHRHAGRIVLRQQSAGVRALHIIHRNPQLPIEFATVVNADDMRMPQGRGHVGLPLESAPDSTLSVSAAGKTFSASSRGSRGWRAR